MIGAPDGSLVTMQLVSPLTLAESGYYGASWPAALLHARPYSIRIATGADVDALVHIEGLCWVPALQAERARGWPSGTTTPRYT